MAAELSNEGWSSSDFRAMCDSFSLMKKMDVITLPSDFVDELIARQYKADKEGLLQMFREMGSEVAGVVRIDAPSITQFAELAKEFLGFLPLKMFDLAADEAKGVIEIKAAGVGRRIESTECALEMLLSFLDSYGLMVTIREIGLGTLRILASRNDLEIS